MKWEKIIGTCTATEVHTWQVTGYYVYYRQKAQVSSEHENSTDSEEPRAAWAAKRWLCRSML